MKFKTKYNLSKSLWRSYLSKDNVDRLSYVDNSEMVKRLLLSGENLRNYRAQVRQSALYDTKQVLSDKDVKAPVLPQYPVDMVELTNLARRIEDISKSLNRDFGAESGQNKNHDLNNGAIAPALEKDKTKSSQVSEQKPE